MSSLYELLTAVPVEKSRNDSGLPEFVTKHWAEVVESSESGSAVRRVVSSILSSLSLAARRNWFACLNSIYGSPSWLNSHHAEILHWLWSTAYENCRDAFVQFDSCQRAQQSRSADGAADTEFVEDTYRDCEYSPEDAEVLTELSRTCVTWLSGAHNLVFTVCKEVLSTPEPDPVAIHFACKVTREILCLDDWVQHNFPLMNTVWKSFGQAVAVFGPAMPPVGTSVDDNIGFPFSEAVDRLLTHTDKSLDALLQNGVPCDDTKAATKHTRVLRFLCSHLTTIFKDPAMMRHTVSQWTRVVLVTVRLSQIVCGAQASSHPVVDALRQFVAPVFVTVSLSYVSLALVVVSGSLVVSNCVRKVVSRC
jgi:hypothetical protein